MKKQSDQELLDKLRRRGHVVIMWKAEDVQHASDKKLSKAKAQDILDGCADVLQDMSIERGWQVIEEQL